MSFVFPTKYLVHSIKIFAKILNQLQFYWMYTMWLTLFLCVCAKSLSPVQLFATLWTVACQAPLSMGFSRQENESGLPCPPAEVLPNPGIKPPSPAAPAFLEDSFTAETLEH